MGRRVVKIIALNMFYYIFLCVWVHAYLCIIYMQSQQRSEDGIRPPGAGVLEVEATCGCWE